MPEDAHQPPAASEPIEDVRVPEDALDDLASTVAKLADDSRTHRDLLDRLASETPNTTTPAAPDAPDGDLDSVFILALLGPAYDRELAALTDWVNHLLLPEYGREISATRPWCHHWAEHPEAVARLHALWLAWQQLTATDAGLIGPSLWHRDHLDHAWLQLRAADGPFAACTTNPAHPRHRLLPGPAPATDASDDRQTSA